MPWQAAQHATRPDRDRHNPLPPFDFVSYRTTARFRFPGCIYRRRLAIMPGEPAPGQIADICTNTAFERNQKAGHSTTDVGSHEQEDARENEGSVASVSSVTCG